MVGAGLASACCIGPLLAVGLGISGLGAATALEANRSYLLLGTFGCLGVGYYFTYRKNPCGEDGECVKEESSNVRRIVLHVATILAIGLALFPYFL